jgi:hypothetical protein
MTDPIFETREALEAWAEANGQYAIYLPFDTMRSLEVAEEISAQIARVKAAHAHLLKGQDDG